MSPRTRRSGFSMIELIVVLVIVVVLLGLVVPALRSAQARRANTDTLNNLKQLNLACHNCNDVYRRLPPAFDRFGAFKQAASVHVYLLPFIEQDQLYRKFLNEQMVSDAKVDTFIAAEDPSSRDKDLAGVQNFAGNLRGFSDKGMRTKYNADMPALARIEPGTASFPRTFRDGTSNTISFATKYGFCGEDGGSRYAAAPDTKQAAFVGQNAAKISAHPSDPTATFQLQPLAKDCCASPLMAQSFDVKLPAQTHAPFRPRIGQLPPGWAQLGLSKEQLDRIRALQSEYDAKTRKLDNELRDRLDEVLTKEQKDLMRRRMPVGLFDGSFRFIGVGVSAETWNRAMQPNDGLFLGEDW